MTRLLLLAVFVTATFVSPALAQQPKTSALIAQELDKQLAQPLEVSGTLPQAMKKITADTGVPLDIAPQTYDLLPWGEQTTINAKIANQTLRSALVAITRKLGLTIEPKDEAIEVRPLPALRRLGRRATVEELAVLDLLSRTELKRGDAERPTVKQVLSAIDAQLDELKSPFHIENRAFSIDDFAVAVARGASMLDALEAIPAATDATWYPWGQSLLVRPKVDHVRALLGDKTITRSWRGVDVSQVLTELASISGVTFTIEPGATQRIPPDGRNIVLVLENAPIQQALESIAGFTGLGWSVNDRGVYIWNASTAGAGGAANREPGVGLLQLDNGMQVIVRDSQIPADLREYVKHKTAQQFDKMRQQMKDENFVPPATQPTSAPTTRRADDL